MFVGLLTQVALACQLDVTPGASGSLSWTTDCAGDLRVQIQQKRFTYTARVPAADGAFVLPPAAAAGLRGGPILWRVQHPDGTEVRGQVDPLDLDTDGDGLTGRQGDCDEVDARYVAYAVGPAGLRNLSGEVQDAAAAGGVAAITLVDEDLFVCGGGVLPVNITVAGGVSSVSGDAVLDGQGGPVLHVTGGADVAVEGVTLTNGDRALWCVESAVSFVDAVLSGNTGSGGGAVAAATCDVSLTDSLVLDNVSTQGGGGLRMDVGSTLALTRTTVMGNTCTVNGGGIELVGSHGVCDASELWSNSAADGGNVYLVGGGSLDMVDCDMGVVGTDNDGSPNDILSWNGQTTRVYPADVVVNNVCRADGTCGTPVQTPVLDPQWHTFGNTATTLNHTFTHQEPVGAFVIHAAGVDAELLTAGSNCTIAVGYTGASGTPSEYFGPATQVTFGAPSAHFATFDPPLQVPGGGSNGSITLQATHTCDAPSNVSVLVNGHFTDNFGGITTNNPVGNLTWYAYTRL